MAFPTTKVYVSFTAPFATPSWVDITQYVMAFKTTMGRQHELQQVNPSTAQITLYNGPRSASDVAGRFSPWNTGSPYYSGLVPTVPVKITATWSGTTYPVFYGYADSWIPSYAAESVVTLNCSDMLKLLNLDTMDIDTYATYPTANATHYWPLNDLIGSAYAADPVGSAPAHPSGSVTFGAGGPFVTSNATAVTVGAGGFLVAGGSVSPSGSTVSAEGWIKTTSTATTSAQIYTASGFSLGLYLGTGVAFARVNGVLCEATTNLCDGQWHYLAATYDGSQVKLYVDGGQVGDYAVTGSLSTSLVDVGITGDGADFAQVACYSSVLSGTTIFNQHATGATAFPTQDSGARINAVLNLAGVPAGLNNVGSGNITVAGATSSLDKTTMMAYSNQVVNSERGLLFQDAAGVVQFRNRHYVYENSSSSTSQATYGYASGQLHYVSSNLVPQIDDLDTWNNINVQRQGGVVQNAFDAASQTAYGRRTLTGYTNLLFTNDTDAYDLATGLLYQYKNPAPRVRSLAQDSTISGGANLPQMLGRTLLDRVTINWRPLDGSSVDFSQQSLIEQITHTVTPEVWTTTWAVTPIGTETFWIWGTSQWGTGVWGF